MVFISFNLFYFCLACETHKDDPQCGHETMHDSKMIGAGHHVRAETNTPIIGILMQPIPEVKDGNSERWT